MPFKLIRDDITTLDVCAVVNAANTSLQRGGGVCGAIFEAAGARAMQAACDAAGPIETGQAVITPGFALKAKYVIHAAGPIYADHTPEQSRQLLRAAYESALRLAVEHDCRSIAFPLISSGIYGYPKAEALAVATEAIRAFLSGHDLDVSLAIFGDMALGDRLLLEDVAAYVGARLAAAPPESSLAMADSDGIAVEQMLDVKPTCVRAQIETSDTLRKRIEQLDDPFSAALLRLIDARNRDDVDIYKRANLDRKLFSKIRSNAEYRPSKRTAVALAVALELNIEETNDLLAKAGYALSPSRKFDVIVEYFIEHQMFDIFAINEVLFAYDQPLLGA